MVHIVSHNSKQLVICNVRLYQPEGIRCLECISIGQVFYTITIFVPGVPKKHIRTLQIHAHATMCHSQYSVGLQTGS